MNITEAMQMAMNGRIDDAELAVFEETMQEYREAVGVEDEATLSLPALAYTFFVAGRIMQAEESEGALGHVSIQIPVHKVQGLIDFLVEDQA